MNEETFSLVKKMTELQGTSGFEHPIREVMRKEITPLVDEVVQDGLGGIFGMCACVKVAQSCPALCRTGQ